MANELLRTKTRNMLAEIAGNEEQASELIERVTGVVKKMAEKPEEEMQAFLLRMRIQPETTVSEFSLDQLTEEQIENLMGKLRGDVIASYKAAHPDCWLADTTEYPILSKALDGDITLIQFVVGKCCETVYSPSEERERIVFLLSSEEEKNRYGGLRAMKFSKEEAGYLKDCANAIGEYYKSLLPEEATNPIKIPEGFVPAEDTTPEVAKEKLPKLLKIIIIN